MNSTRLMGLFLPCFLILLACLPAHAWELSLPTVWRTDLGTLLESTAVAADVDGDGVDEIIAAGRQEMILVDGAGHERWRWRTKGRYMTTPAVLHAADGRLLIYAADNAGQFTCLDGAGKVVWQADLKKGSEWCGPVVSVLEASGPPRVIQCDGSGAVWAFDALSGAVVWQAQVTGAPITPAVADLDADGKREIIVSTTEGQLAALRSDGTLLWSKETTAHAEAWAACAPVVFQASDAKARIVAAHYDNTVGCLDAAGNILWTRPARGGMDSSISIGDFDGDGKPEVFFATQVGVIYRYSEDGKLLWEIDMQGRSLAPGAIVDIDNDGAMEYVLCTQTGRLMIIGQDGAFRFEMQFPHRTIGVTPAFGHFSKDRPTLQMAITGGESGTLTLLDTPAKPGAVAQWLAYRRDTSNAGSWTRDEAKKKKRIKAPKRSKQDTMLPESALITPVNLEDGALLNGHDVEFKIRPDRPIEGTWRAEAVCVSPDGARHSAIGPILGTHGELRLPVDLTQAGPYHFSWSLTEEDNTLLASGERVIGVRPFENELALLHATIRELEDAKSQVRGNLFRTSEALRYECVALDECEWDLKTLINKKGSLKEILRTVLPLTKRLQRDLQIAAGLKVGNDLPAGTSLIPFLGNAWESRAVDAQLPREFQHEFHMRGPLLNNMRCIGRLIVPGEHDVVPVMLLNITGAELAVRVKTTPNDAFGVALLHSQAVPTSQGETSWDPLPPLDATGILNIPPLQSREVWIDVDAATAAPGKHSVTVIAEALNGAAVQDAAPSPLTIPPAETKITIDYTVLPFQMAPPGAMRLCAWANAKDGDYADLLAHGNNVFITPLPAVKRDAKGALTASDNTVLDGVLEKLRGHDVVVLLQGLPTLQGEVGSEQYGAELTVYLKELAQHFAEKGLDTGHFALYPHDEPAGNGWTAVNSFVAFGNAVRAANPSIQIYQDGGCELPMGQVMAPVTDIWTPSYFDLPQKSEVMDLMRHTGKALWSYNCGYGYSRPVGPNLKNCNIVAEYRNAALFALNYGATGIGFWSYNIGGDLWTRTWEEYSMVYAGNGKPVTSRRWEAVREGIEDARILIALKAMASITTNTELRDKVRIFSEETLPALMTQSSEETRLGLARYVLDATNNEDAVNRLRDDLMDCVELASAEHH